MKRLIKRLYIIIRIMLLVSITHVQAQAQDIPVITIAMPLLSQEIPEETIANFEAEYGVQVQVKADPTVPFLPDVASSPDAYFTALQQYAQSADVVYVDRNVLNGVGAQTGFFLDLTPLTASDSDLNIGDFYAEAWEAFQWDGQMLAVPTGFERVVLSYNPAAFDAVGISYPTGHWTIDEFATAARALTQRDAAGTVIQAGYESSFAFDAYLIHAFATQSLLDTAQFPSQLNPNNPELANILSVWQQLRAEGVIGQGDNMANTVSTMSVFPTDFFNGSAASAALLPNNHIGIDVGGYAISAGTSNVDLAYTLIRALTQSEELVLTTHDTYAARQSLTSETMISQQVLDVVNMGADIVPYADMRYDDFLNQAMDVDDAQVALTTMASVLPTRIQTAQRIAAETNIVVASPRAIGEGIHLDFGIATNVLPLPNQEQWEIAVSEFVAQDPEVASIAVEGGFGTVDSYASTYDCFALSTDWIDRLDPNTIRRLDPLIMQDAGFNPDDFVATVYEEINQEGMIYAYPLTLAPRYLAINTPALSNQGIDLPIGLWTVDQFGDVIARWHSNTGTAAFMVNDMHDILTLAAAYGALPLDTSTTPPTANFNAPETVNALQQIMALTATGELGYSSVISLQPMGSANSVEPIQPVILSTTGVGMVSQDATWFNYPRNNNMTVASHSVVGGAISTQSDYTDACYRWLRFVSEQSYIFESMPVRSALVDDSQNQNMTLYRQVLQQDAIVNIPYINKVGSNDTFVLAYFLGSALDAHAINGQELGAALQIAQEQADQYLSCRLVDTVQGCALSINPAIETVLR